MSFDVVLDISGVERAGTFVIGRRRRNDGRSETLVARLRIPLEERKNKRNPYLTKSLKTTDIENAKKKAFEWRQQILLRSDQTFRGLPDFRTAYSMWIDYVRSGRSGKERIRRFETSFNSNLLPFFDSVPIAAINQKSMNDWLLWRLEHNSSKDGNVKESTIQKDKHALGQFARWLDRNFATDLTSKISLDLDNFFGSSETRRHRFSTKQADQLIDVARARAEQELKATHKEYWSRCLIFGLISVLRYTGMRVSEARLLKFRDVKVVETTTNRRIDFMRQISSKTSVSEQEADSSYAWDMAGLVFSIPPVKHVSHKRNVAPRPTLIPEWLDYLDLLRSRILGYTSFPLGCPHKSLTNTQYSDEFEIPEDLPVFPLLNGRPFQRISRPHDTLLRCAEREIGGSFLMQNGEKMSASNWRPTYATEMIDTWISREEDVPIFTLAENMGTSVAMIYKHYKQELGTAIPERLMI